MAAMPSSSKMVRSAQAMVSASNSSQPSGTDARADAATREPVERRSPSRADAEVGRFRLSIRGRRR